MKRILVSQNENNNGTDYIVIDGKLENSEEVIRQVSKKIFSTDNWRRIHKDDFLEVKKNGNELLLKSYYEDKDIAGRSIYYLYVIENDDDDIDAVLGFLEKDSEVINRTLDKERTLQTIKSIKSDKKLKSKITYFILAVIALSAIILLTKIFTNE